MQLQMEQGNFSSKDYYQYMQLSSHYNKIKEKQRISHNPKQQERLHRLEDKAVQWIHELARTNTI